MPLASASAANENVTGSSAADPNFLAKFIGGWAATWFAVVALRAASNKFRRFLDQRGVTLAFFAVAASTSTGTNRLYEWGKRHRPFLRSWFSFGIITTATGFVLSTFFLLFNLHREIGILMSQPYHQQQPQSQQRDMGQSGLSLFSASEGLDSAASAAGVTNQTRNATLTPSLIDLGTLPPSVFANGTSTMLKSTPAPGASNDLVDSASKRSTLAGIEPAPLPTSASEYEPTTAILPKPPPPPEPHESILTIAIPGLTVPWQQFPYLVIAILISVVFHEFGHALAAAAYRVRTSRIGLFWMLFFPGAFVELDETGIFTKLPPIQRIKITTAGIWHNVILCLFCTFTILSLNILLSPFYAPPIGVGVVNVKHDILPALAASLPKGAIITGLAGEPVSNLDDWYHILRTLHTAPQLASLDEEQHLDFSQSDSQSQDATLVIQAEKEASSYQRLLVELAHMPPTHSQDEDQLSSLLAAQDRKVTVKSPQRRGICVRAAALDAKVEENISSPSSCCNFATSSQEDSINATSNGLCFWRTRNSGERLTLPAMVQCDVPSFQVRILVQQQSSERTKCSYFCLAEIRKYVLPDAKPCAWDSHCSQFGDAVCLHPILDEHPSSRGMRVLPIKFKMPKFPTNILDEEVERLTSPTESNSASEDTLHDNREGHNRYLVFLGRPAELALAVHGSEFNPREFLERLFAWLIPLFPESWQHAFLGGWTFTVRWPGMLLRLLKYVLSVSASLALLNAAPVHFADGALTARLVGQLIAQDARKQKLLQRIQLQHPQLSTSHSGEAAPIIGDGVSPLGTRVCCLKCYASRTPEQNGATRGYRHSQSTLEDPLSREDALHGSDDRQSGFVRVRRPLPEATSDQPESEASPTPKGVPRSGALAWALRMAKYLIPSLPAYSDGTRPRLTRDYDSPQCRTRAVPGIETPTSARSRAMSTASSADSPTLQPLMLPRHLSPQSRQGSTSRDPDNRLRLRGAMDQPIFLPQYSFPSRDLPLDPLSQSHQVRELSRVPILGGSPKTGAKSPPLDITMLATPDDSNLEPTSYVSGSSMLRGTGWTPGSRSRSASVNSPFFEPSNIDTKPLNLASRPQELESENDGSDLAAPLLDMSAGAVGVESRSSTSGLRCIYCSTLCGSGLSLSPYVVLRETVSMGEDDPHSSHSHADTSDDFITVGLQPLPTHWERRISILLWTGSFLLFINILLTLRKSLSELTR